MGPITSIGLMKGLEDLYRNEFGYYNSKMFDKLGYNSFSAIKNYNKCCSYITKYISKDCVKNSHNQIYFCSRGLKRAEKYELKNSTKLYYNFCNDYCKVKYFDLNDLDDEDKKNLISLTDLNNYIK